MNVPMIEIEKKFLLTDQQRHDLLDGAHELESRMVEDSYLDTDDYGLTMQDLWFRVRDGSYELKAPLQSSGSETTTNRYEEITDLAAIAEKLGIDSATDFDTALPDAGIKKFITVFTNRTSYEKDGFHIDVDSATYLGSKFTYALAEIELLIENEAQADSADDRITQFAKTFGLTTDQVVLGKVGEYLRVERPDHYAKLIEVGVFKS